MGARLQYAKVIDRQLYFDRGARVHPGLESHIFLNGEPGIAGAFLVMRAWTDDHGTFTEQWCIETPGGTRVYESAPRELHLATTSHVERLQDEVADLKLDYVADDYRVVFTLDEHRVAAVNVPVTVDHHLEDSG